MAVWNLLFLIFGASLAISDTRDYSNLIMRCRTKYAHPMECESLVKIAQGLGLRLDANATDEMRDLHQGGWLEAQTPTVELLFC